MLKKVPYDYFLRKHVLVLRCLYEINQEPLDAYWAIKGERNSYYGLVNRYYREGKITKDIWDSFDNFFILLRMISQGEVSKKELTAYLKLCKGRMVSTRWIQEKIDQL